MTKEEFEALEITQYDLIRIDYDNRLGFMSKWASIGFLECVEELYEPSTGLFELTLVNRIPFIKSNEIKSYVISSYITKIEIIKKDFWNE